MKNIKNRKLAYILFISSIAIFIIVILLYVFLDKQQSKNFNPGFNKDTGKFISVLPYADFEDYYKVFINNSLWIEWDEEWKMFFSFMRHYIFWDEINWMNPFIKDQVLCLEWKISYKEIDDEFLSKVCKWDNVLEDVNYYREKDLPIKLKMIVSWKKDFDCKYFLKSKYKLKQELIYPTMFSDYMTCLLANQNDKEWYEKIYKEYSNFISLLNDWKCNSLSDTKLKVFCEKIISIKIKNENSEKDNYIK